MPLIRAFEIENFRSIRKLRTTNVSAYMPIIGLNSSGKSNVLRALNLFFNNIVDDENGALVLARDYSDYAPKGKKRLVSVSVDLDIGSPMKVRGQKSFLDVAGLDNNIVIRRSWSADPQSREVVESFAFGREFEHLKIATVDELPSLLAFIRAIIFRYVPNHVRPSELIARLLRPLRSELVSRLQATRDYRDSDVDDVMSALVRVGDSMFQSVSQKVTSGLTQLRVAPNLPGSFAELAFEVGLNSISDSGVSHSPDLEGSGTQSFMLLHVLDLADRAARRGGFGWTQATIWAFEEPESFLHAGLRSRYSRDIVNYANEEPRRQVFVTTHQDEFVRVSERAWIATRGSDGTAMINLSARDAVLESNKRAISTFRHPLLESPDSPILLAEGRSDVAYLKAAVRAAGIRPRWRILSPDDDLVLGSSGDALKQYLKWNQSALASRPDSSPVFVLRDWEATDGANYEGLLAAHPHSHCFTCPEAQANPELGKSFVGIERFLETSLIVAEIGSSNMGHESAAEGQAYSVKRPILLNSKKALGSAVENGSPVGAFMEGLAKWIDVQIENVMLTIAPDAFL